MKKVIGLFAACVLALAIGCTKGDVDEYAMITFMIGNVTINNVTAQIGDIIKDNDTVKTEEEAFCDVKIGSSVIRVKENSKVVIASLIRDGNVEKTSLGLDTGKMLCKPKKLLKSESFMVKTPTAVAGVRGTKFTIEADSVNTTRIKVFDGNVKVIKKVKQLEQLEEGTVERLLDESPAINQEEKIVITEKEVTDAEKVVEQAMETEGVKGEAANLASAIEMSKSQVVISNAKIEKFAIEDFAKENEELIAVQEKPKEVVKKLIKVINQEREMPKPDGRLLITKFDIYFIKEGKVLWEGKVVNEPVHHAIKLHERDEEQVKAIYVASGEYVFCAASDGPVLWKRKLVNSGVIQIQGDTLIVESEGKQVKLDLINGQMM